MLATDVQPAAPDGSRAARPLSMLGSVAVAGTTAAFVFAAGVYIAERGMPENPSRTTAPPKTPAPSAAATRDAPMRAEREGSEAQGAAAEGASARPMAPTSAAHSASAPPAAPAPPAASAVASAAPRRGFGNLRVAAARDATVYVMGVPVGAVNRFLEVRCGRFFVRIGEPTKDGPRWLGEGRSIAVACGEPTEASF